MDSCLNSLYESQDNRLSASRIFQNPNCPIYRVQFRTQCVKELLRIAAEDYALAGVHGGCARENIASARAMEKGGMVQYGTEENGDPLFRFCTEK